jgi:hypothetical protein
MTQTIAKKYPNKIVKLTDGERKCSGTVNLAT